MKNKFAVTLLFGMLLSPPLGSMGQNAWAQQQASIPISVTIPAPQPITVTVSQSVTVGKATYLAAGTLTLTLTSVVADSGTVTQSFPVLGTLPPTTSPLSELPPHDWPPVVQQFKDPLGSELMASLPLGGAVILSGQNFGDSGGLIFIGHDLVPFTSWKEDEVRLTIPPTLLPTADFSIWTIERDGGAYNTAWGPPLRPAAG